MDENNSLIKKIEEYDNLILEKPHVIYYYYLRGLLKFELKDYTGTCKDLELAIELGLKDYSIYFILGISYINQELNNEYAVECLNRSIDAQKSGYLCEKEKFMESILFDGEIKQCKLAFDKLQNNFSYEYIYYIRATLIMKLNSSSWNNNQAINDFNKTIEIYPNFIKAYFLRGKLFYKENQYYKSLNDFNKAIELDDNFPEVYSSRAITKIKLKDYLGAIHDCEKVLTFKGYSDNEHVYHNLNLCYLNLAEQEFNKNNFINALNYFEVYLKYSKIRSDVDAEMYLISMLKYIDSNIVVDDTNSIYQFYDNLQISFYHKQHNNDWIAFNKANNLNFADNLKIEFINNEEFNAKNLIEYKKNYKVGFGKHEGKTIKDILINDPLDILECILNVTHFSISNQLLIEYFNKSEILYNEAILINLLKLKLINQRKIELENEKNGVILDNAIITFRINDFNLDKIENDWLFISKNEYQKSTCGILNKKGEFLLPCRISSISDFSDGLASITITQEPEENYSEYGYDLSGYIDRNGKIVIPLNYAFCWPFKNGIALVSKYRGYPHENEYNYFFINKENKQLGASSCEPITFKGSYAEICREIYSLKYTTKVYGLIDDNFKTIVDCKFIKIDVYEKKNNDFTDTIIVLDNCKIFILKENMEEIFSFSKPDFNYEYVGQFVENRAQVCLGKKWGFINIELNLLSPLIYEDVKDFKDNMAAVRLNKKWGFIDINGQLSIPCIYDEVRNFIKGLAIIEIDNLYGIIDKSGNIIIKPKYKAIIKEYEYYSLKIKDSNIWEHYFITENGIQSKVEKNK